MQCSRRIDTQQIELVNQILYTKRSLSRLQKIQNLRHVQLSNPIELSIHEEFGQQPAHPPMIALKYTSILRYLQAVQAERSLMNFAICATPIQVLVYNTIGSLHGIQLKRKII